jgi:hypothetical protein
MDEARAPGNHRDEALGDCAPTRSGCVMSDLPPFQADVGLSTLVNAVPNPVLRFGGTFLSAHVGVPLRAGL